MSRAVVMKLFSILNSDLNIVIMIFIHPTYNERAEVVKESLFLRGFCA